MKKFIPNADVEYFWEYEYGFGMDFLKKRIIKEYILKVEMAFAI